MPEADLSSVFSSLHLPERYTMVRLIGRGGSAVVFEAYDNALNRNVAIKVLEGAALELSQLKRFHREAKITSGFAHPNIVKILDFGVNQNGQPYLVMEYVAGQTLREIISTNQRLTSKEARQIFTGIASALKYAQELDIFHRDLKPDNVIVLPNMSAAKVIDFGLANYAKISDSFLTQKGALLGTPAYMSPDTANKRAFDTRSEVYTFGCVLFEALVGHTPFSATSPVMMLAKHRTEEPPLVLDLNPAVDIDLSRVVEKCLRKLPEDRFQSFDEIISILDGMPFQDEGGITLKSNDKSSRKLKKLPVVLLLISLALLVGFFVQLNSAPDKVPATIRVQKKQRPELASMVMDVSQYPNITYLPEQKYIKLKGDFNRKDFLGILKYPDAQGLDAVFGQHLDSSGFSIVSRLRLQAVNLSHSDADDKIVHVLAGIPSLERVVLRDTKCTDEGVEELVALPRLNELILDFCRLSDRSISKLGKTVSLKNLSLNDSLGPLSEKGLMSLRTLRLESFSFRNNNLTDQKIKAISQLNAESIDISNCKVDDRMIENFNNQKVKKLDVSRNQIDLPGLGSLLKLPRIESISLSRGGTLTPQKINVLKRSLKSSCQVSFK
jgi:serine/threonine protein kinase